MEEDDYKLCFIISHKYYRQYESYIQYYVDNIQKYYKNSLTIIVDNNSMYINDIKEQLKDYTNVVILSNDSECKFEIGAYKVGIHYLIENNLVNEYDFCIFTQDNFILTNKYNFSLLKQDNVTACSIGIGGNCYHNGLMNVEESQSILKKLTLQNDVDKIGLCWCNSFILDNSKILEFMNILRDIVITIRRQSEYSERYLAAILFFLND